MTTKPEVQTINTHNLFKTIIFIINTLSRIVAGATLKGERIKRFEVLMGNDKRVELIILFDDDVIVNYYSEVME
jgi:hypothetical protein